MTAKHADPFLLNDVEVYSIDHSFLVLDQGIDRARQLQSGKPQWEEGSRG